MFISERFRVDFYRLFHDHRHVYTSYYVKVCCDIIQKVYIYIYKCFALVRLCLLVFLLLG